MIETVIQTDFFSGVYHIFVHLNRFLFGRRDIDTDFLFRWLQDPDQVENFSIRSRISLSRETVPMPALSDVSRYNKTDTLHPTRFQFSWVVLRSQRYVRKS